MAAKPRWKAAKERILAKLNEMVEQPEVLDWVLALFHAAGGRMRSRLHVQKALFIASRHIERLREAVEFKAYKMGPWSGEVHDALELATTNGWIVESGGQHELAAREKAEEAWRLLSGEEGERLREVAEFVNEMDEEELLLYTYAVYGGGEKSDVLDRLLRRRREIAVRLLKKGLVSTGLTAEIVGLPYPEFVEYLRRKVKSFTAETRDTDGVASP